MGVGATTSAQASFRPGPDDLFVDIAAEVGLDFVHFNGMSGQYYFSEMMSSGCAVLDYDSDGDLDVLLLQGRLLNPGASLRQATFPPSFSLGDRLYRNELQETGELRFTNVTAQSGLGAKDSEHGDHYSIGAATGDIDGDGHVDIYITVFGGPNRLWRNRGDGTFEDLTRGSASNVGDPRWSVPAVFFDYDRDGNLDLFTGNYVDYSIATHKLCTTELGRPNYCGPLSYQPVSDALWRGRGDGTFEDVTGRSGLLSADAGGALGAVAADFNLDGRPDLYVGNDGLPNHLWMQQPDGTFHNEALLGGVAVNSKGQPEASMGMDTADFDNDGDEDLFITHLTRETHTLYVNDGSGQFDDVTMRAGLAAPTFEATGFGTAWLDIDNDGWLDLLTVTGAVKILEELALAGDKLPLHQKNQLFRNQGDGTFREITAEAGAVFRRSEVSRGAAFGDLDNDGDTDVVVSQNSGPVRLLQNRIGQDQGWIGLRLLTGPSGRDALRDALGAWVEITVGDATYYRRVHTAASYASANDPRILVGLGVPHDAATPLTARVRVHWPDRTGPAIETWNDVPVNTYTELRRGEGAP